VITAIRQEVLDVVRHAGRDEGAVPTEPSELLTRLAAVGLQALRCRTIDDLLDVILDPLTPVEEVQVRMIAAHQTMMRATTR
jgi:hypothetical protein